MSFQYRSGLAHAGTMIAPGTPFLKRGQFTTSTGSQEVHIVFPSIAKRVQVFNESANVTGTVMRVHFASRVTGTIVDASGSGCNAPVYVGEAVEIHGKCPDVFVSRDEGISQVTNYLVIGELTGIVEPDFQLSGSGINIVG